jgi:flagellar protein FlaJ
MGEAAGRSPPPEATVTVHADRVDRENDTDRICRWVEVAGRRVTPWLRRWVDPNGTGIDSVDRALMQANTSGTAAAYVTRAVGVAVVTGMVLVSVGTVLGYGVFGTAVAAGLAGVSAGGIGSIGGAAVWLLRPYLHAARRRREIDLLLPDAVAYAYALAAGGLDQLALLEALADAEDAYGEVSVEFQRVVSEMQYTGTDYQSALRRRSGATPSESLSAFIGDLIAVVDAGGRIEPFLREKTERYRRLSRREQERRLETLELFGELYVTLSVFPLLLIIVLVVVATMGEPTAGLIFVTVYALIPLSGTVFLLLVAAVMRDEPGDGSLDAPSPRVDARTREENVDSIGASAYDSRALFDHIQAAKRRHRIVSALRAPQDLLQEHPHYSLFVTLPLAMGFVFVAGVSGHAPVVPAAWIERPVQSTVIWVYVPVAVVVGPLGVITEWNRRTTRAVTDRLAETLRTLAAANKTGQTLVEALCTVSAGSSDPLARELRDVHTKVTHGMRLRTALVEFNNTYTEPKLARTVTLIADARSASSQIATVLTTAAETIEIRDDLERERRSRTRMQVTVIGVTYLTMLGVMAVLQTQLVGALGGLSSGGAPAGVVGSAGGGVGIDPALLSLAFFHAATVQAIVSGAVSGYLRAGELRAGIPFVLAYGAVALGVWSVIG